MKKTIEFTLNGVKYKKGIEMHSTLLHFIRDEMGLIGTKEGCGNGECGACVVYINQKPMRSCLILACEIEGKEVTTIEGLGDGYELDVVQEAFIEAGAVQCGFCTPGFVMATKALLEINPKPEKKDIRKAFSGHLCRCTGYETLFTAVQLAASKIAKMKEENHGSNC